MFAPCSRTSCTQVQVTLLHLVFCFVFGRVTHTHYIVMVWVQMSKSKFGTRSEAIAVTLPSHVSQKPFTCGKGKS